MVELVDITEGTFKRSGRGVFILICSITAKIHALDTDVASAPSCIKCLNLLLHRIYAVEKSEWLAQSLVTRVFLTGKYPQMQGQDGVKDMQLLLDGNGPRLHSSQTYEGTLHLPYPIK